MKFEKEEEVRAEEVSADKTDVRGGAEGRGL